MEEGGKEREVTKVLENGHAVSPIDTSLVNFRRLTPPAFGICSGCHHRFRLSSHSMAIMLANATSSL